MNIDCIVSLSQADHYFVTVHFSAASVQLPNAQLQVDIIDGLDFTFFPIKWPSIFCRREAAVPKARRLRRRLRRRAVADAHSEKRVIYTASWKSVTENGTCGASRKTVMECVTENMTYAASWKSVTESGTCGVSRKEASRKCVTESVMECVMS